MKEIMQIIVANALSLYACTLLFSGLTVRGGIEAFLFGGLFIAIGEYILKPLLKIISLPLSIITLGFFSSFINVIVLYVISLVYSKIHVSSFDFSGYSLYGLSIPSFHANIFLSYALISATIYFLAHIILWFFRE